MKISDVDIELKNSIFWDKNEIVENDIFLSDAKCDIETKRRLERRNKLIPLYKISRGINLLEILSNSSLNWYITPVFNKNVAIRTMGNDSAIGYKLRNKKYKTLVYLMKPIINLKKTFSEGYDIPDPPPIMPKNVIELAKYIKLFQKRGMFGKIPKDYDCEPMVLYKPASWQLIKTDSALVAKIGGDFRVFAIWGDIVEQAEIVSFETEGMLI